MQPSERYQYSSSDIIGNGTTATVYRALDKQTFQRSQDTEASLVALKKMCLTRLEKKNPLFSKYIEQEILLMTDLKHPNVLNLIDTFKTKENGEEYMSMVLELCREDLSSYLHTQPGKRISQEDAMDFMKQLISAMYYLKSKKIVHRDLKPENILLKYENGRDILKISDFGLSKKIAQGDLTSTYCGTPMYMAPEAMSGGGYSDKADLWSLGIILYQMITGNRPFGGNTREELERNLKTDPVRYPNGVRHDICGPLIDCLLEKRPERRISWEDLYNYFGPEFYQSLIKLNPSQNDVSVYEILLDLSNECTSSDTLNLLTFVLDELIHSPNPLILAPMKKKIEEKLRSLITAQIPFSDTPPDSIILYHALRLAKTAVRKESISKKEKAKNLYKSSTLLLEFLLQQHGTCNDARVVTREDILLCMKNIESRLAVVYQPSNDNILSIKT